MSKKKNKKNKLQNTSKETLVKEAPQGRTGFFSLIDKIIIILYLGVGFIQPMRAFDVSVTQWFYISILNLVVFSYFFFFKDKYPFVIENKLMKFVFGGALLFLVFSILSITQSISVSESIVFLCILLSTLIAFFLLYILLKDTPKKSFDFIVYVIAAFLFVEAIEVINHFAIKNGSKPRSNELFKGLNPTYGNRNILAASIIIKTSISFYLVLASEGFKKYIIGLVLFFIGSLSVFLIGARTALYAMPIVFLVLIIGDLIINSKKNLLLNFKKHTVPVLIVFSLSFLSSLSINKIHKTKLNTLNDLVFTKGKKNLYEEKNIKITSDTVGKLKTANVNRSLASDSGRKKFWGSAIDLFKTSPVLGVGLGNWKMLYKEDLIKANKKNSFYYPTRVHNDFLQVLCDTGFFGFLIFLSFFGIVYFLLIRNIFSVNLDSGIRIISLTLLGGLMAYNLDSLSFKGESAFI